MAQWWNGPIWTDHSPIHINKIHRNYTKTIDTSWISPVSRCQEGFWDAHMRRERYHLLMMSLRSKITRITRIFSCDYLSHNGSKFEIITLFFVMWHMLAINTAFTSNASIRQQLNLWCPSDKSHRSSHIDQILSSLWLPTQHDVGIKRRWGRHSLKDITAAPHHYFPFSTKFRWVRPTLLPGWHLVISLHPSQML